MPAGGRLRVSTGEADLRAPAKAAANGVAAGQYVRISVSDNGAGMTPEVAARAFDPFFTTKPVGQGTGLGLSMIYGFARQSEGAARISSAPGEGTTVALLLPRHRGRLRPEAEGLPAETRQREASGERVLVVDDDPVVRSLVVEVLRDRGYGTLEAEDGPSGLAVLRGSEHLDLLVSDIGLPGFDGRQLAERARMLRPGLPVLFMTGYAAEAALPSGFLEPGMELITKPFEIAAFADRLGRMLATIGT